MCPPPEFLLTSAPAGVVHYLSGLTTATRRSLADPGVALLLAALVISLVRVTIRVPRVGFFPCTFCLSSHPVLFILPSRYFFAIGLSLYLALDAHTTPSHCTTKQCYSSAVPRMWALTTPAALSIASRPLSTTAITIRAASPSFATTPEIHVCFFSCPY